MQKLDGALDSFSKDLFDVDAVKELIESKIQELAADVKEKSELYKLQNAYFDGGAWHALIIITTCCAACQNKPHRHAWQVSSKD